MSVLILIWNLNNKIKELFVVEISKSELKWVCLKEFASWGIQNK